MLPGGVGWRTPAINQVIAQSDGLVLETMIDETRPQSLADNFTRLGVRAGLPPFLERFEAKNRPAIAAAIVKSGIPASRYDQMETWAATLTLVGRQTGSSGFKGADGVETILRKNFVRAGKPVGQLETNVDQLSMYDGLSEHAQRSMLTGNDRRSRRAYALGPRPARRDARHLGQRRRRRHRQKLQRRAGAAARTSRTPFSPAAMRAGRAGSTSAWTSPEA